MNLHGIVSGAISAVNPPIPVTININQGYNTSSSGKRTPNIVQTVTNVIAQVQSETYKDLVQGEGVNQNGIKRTFYFNGLVQGTVRWTQQGGDTIIMPDGSTWLTVQVLEIWQDWCKVAAVLQNGS